MKKINFREDVFRGTLADLLEQGKPDIADSNTLCLAHEWLRMQLREPANILPVRKSSRYPLRGSLHSIGDCRPSFMPVDNEPLADLYHRWIQGCEIDSSPVGRLLTEDKIVASWRCDQTPRPCPTMRFKGVKTSFRDRGLKLAHISDAGRNFNPDLKLPEQITIRFLRTLSPFNVFLFPSGRCCEFRFISSNVGWQPKTVDWAEDPELRQIALAWLIKWQGDAALDALADFRSELKPRREWLKIAQGTLVEVRPKVSVTLDVELKPKLNQNPAPNPKFSAHSSKVTSSGFPRVSKTSAVTVLEAVEMLRLWRGSYAQATQLDGGSGNNPDHWLHIRMEGYNDNESFTSRYGPSFQGQDYNGVVNFHGDTKIQAIDRFIELIEVAEDYHDVLRPSATYETGTKPEKNRVKPKFALQGYLDRVEGFFLYHDEW